MGSNAAVVAVEPPESVVDLMIADVGLDVKVRK